MKKTLLATMALLTFVVNGCTTDPKSGEGFTLPEGESARGQQAFAQLQCNACHTVTGVEFEKLETSEEMMIALGGEKRTVTTYGELVTSIINPSHRFASGYTDDEIKTEGESSMRIYNDEITVTQLTDIVTFLQLHYDVKAYQPTPYMPFY